MEGKEESRAGPLARRLPELLARSLIPLLKRMEEGKGMLRCVEKTEKMDAERPGSIPTQIGV